MAAERDDILSVVNRVFVKTDARDWAAVRACFAPSVHFDMTSVAGGSPATLTPEPITEAWDAGLRPIEHVHHQTGNFDVSASGDHAAVSCYGIAYHYRKTRSGRNTRLFVGSYDFELRREAAGWKVTLFRFKLKFVDGNLELEKEP
jgi:hypothetical protein